MATRFSHGSLEINISLDKFVLKSPRPAELAAADPFGALAGGTFVPRRPAAKNYKNSFTRGPSSIDGACGR